MPGIVITPTADTIPLSAGDTRTIADLLAEIGAGGGEAPALATTPGVQVTGYRYMTDEALPIGKDSIIDDLAIIDDGDTLVLTVKRGDETLGSSTYTANPGDSMGVFRDSRADSVGPVVVSSYFYLGALMFAATGEGAPYEPQAGDVIEKSGALAAKFSFGPDAVTPIRGDGYTVVLDGVPLAGHFDRVNEFMAQSDDAFWFYPAILPSSDSIAYDPSRLLSDYGIFPGDTGSIEIQKDDLPPVSGTFTALEGDTLQTLIDWLTASFPNDLYGFFSATYRIPVIWVTGAITETTSTSITGPVFGQLSIYQRAPLQARLNASDVVSDMAIPLPEKDALIDKTLQYLRGEVERLSQEIEQLRNAAPAA